MTDGDKDLRDQLALSELNPDSVAYRQMRLSQTLGRFKSRRDTTEADPDATGCYSGSDPGKDSLKRLSPDDFDLVESMREAESEEPESEASECQDCLEKELD